jgi:hypothetical protein
VHGFAILRDHAVSHCDQPPRIRLEFLGRRFDRGVGVGRLDTADPFGLGGGTIDVPGRQRSVRNPPGDSSLNNQVSRWPFTHVGPTRPAVGTFPKPPRSRALASSLPPSPRQNVAPLDPIRPRVGAEVAGRAGNVKAAHAILAHVS